MLNVDEAFRVGLLRYRELYPIGVIPYSVESQASFSVIPGSSTHTVHVCFWIKQDNGDSKPLVFFEADVDRESGGVTVVKSESVELLLSAELSEGGEGLCP